MSDIPKESLWDRIRVWFHDSESIFWARLQMLIGAAVAALSLTDPALLKQLVDAFGLAKWWPLLVVLAGFATEYARRAREPHDLGVKTADDLSTVMLPIKTADAVEVDKAAGTVTITKAADVPAAVVSKTAGEKV